MAFRNTFRRRARFLLTVALLASAGAVFVAGMSTMAGFQERLKRDQALRRWDVEVQLADLDRAPADVVTSRVANIPGITRVEAWSLIHTSVVPVGQQLNVTGTYPDQGHGSVAVTVIPAESSLTTPPPIAEGRWLRPDDTDAVVIAEGELAEVTRAQSGDTIQLAINGRLTNWRVVGVADPPEHAGGMSSRLVITQAGLKAATGIGQPNLLRIVTAHHDEETRAAVARQVEGALREAGMVVRSAASVSRSAAAGAGHMLPLILVFLGLSVAMAVVGFAGLASTMSTNVMERTREFGVMSAIGARPSTVRRLVVLEGVFVALVSCAVAAVPALLLAAVMSSTLPFGGPFRISLPGVGIWVVLAILGASLATLAPAYRASRLAVREALAYF